MVSERGRWANPFAIEQATEASGLGGDDLGRFEYIKFLPSGEVGSTTIFRYLDRGAYPRLGLVRPDGTMICLERLETETVMASVVASRMAIGFEISESGLVASSVAVRLPETNEFASRDLVYEVDGVGNMRSFVRMVYHDWTTGELWSSSHAFGRKNDYIVVGNEVDPLLDGREVLATYVRDKELTDDQAVFSYQVGIKRHPDKTFTLWASRLGKSLSWRMPWKLWWSDEFLWQFEKTSIEELPELLSNEIVRLGDIERTSPVGHLQNGRGERPSSVS